MSNKNVPRHFFIVCVFIEYETRSELHVTPTLIATSNTACARTHALRATVPAEFRRLWPDSLKTPNYKIMNNKFDA